MNLKSAKLEKSHVPFGLCSSRCLLASHRTRFFDVVLFVAYVVSPCEVKAKGKGKGKSKDEGKGVGNKGEEHVTRL